MYDSVKSWINVPVTVRPYIKRNGAGDREFGPSSTILTYPLRECKVVRNAEGVDITSSARLYLDGSTTIHEFDEVTFEDKKWSVEAIEVFYRDGVPDLKVVYL